MLSPRKVRKPGGTATRNSETRLSEASSLRERANAGQRERERERERERDRERQRDKSVAGRDA